MRVAPSTKNVHRLRTAASTPLVRPLIPLVLLACSSAPSQSTTPRALVDAAAPLPDALSPLASEAGGRVRAKGFFRKGSPPSPNPGEIDVYEYLPELEGPAPLVVALHGCTQSAADYAQVGWNALAEEAGFYVVYPEETAQALRCFRWFEPNEVTRGRGEVFSIAQLVGMMKSRVAISKVFVTGLSAGGAMTAALLATYPDVFAGGAIMAGVPFGCANGATMALPCANPGFQKPAAEWGAVAAAAFPGYSGPYPRVSLWQGDRDTTVAQANLTELAKQWTFLHGVSESSGTAETVLGATHTVFSKGDEARVETYLVSNLGHGVALAKDCGDLGPYRLETALCSTRLAARFLGLVQ